MNKDVKSTLLKFKSLLGLIVLCVIISIAAPRFLNINNILNVLTQVSVNAILAIGMSFVILTGGIDLSVGSTLALVGAIAATFAKSSNGGILVPLLIAIVLGAIIGLFNGIFVSKGKMQAFIVTLASMTIFRGATYVYTNGTPISGISGNFINIGNKKIAGIPMPVLIIFLVFIIAWYILTQTRYGRYVYALGGNEDSARLSGINTDKVKTLVYVISGITAALAGVIVTSRVGSASPNAGSGFELDAIAAVVLGGTSLSGGEGSITGTLIGAMIIGVLNNGLNLMNVSPYYQSIVKGAVILFAILLDKRSKK
ncbi:ABC transporter permease [Clostridium sp. BSD9I1]|uniref:ABC transporter permease n=1 Tax=Clostridium sp. BSD9I1 TaxID=2003589 RepID=UPI001648FD10|nr:ribose ABC transporter permease [Clostridium sp. BSD9I1]